MTSVLLREQQNLFDPYGATGVSIVTPFYTVSVINFDVRQAVSLYERKTKRYGFQPIAIVYSLPKALFVWTLLLFGIQGFWMIFADLSPLLPRSTLFPIAAVLVVVCVTIWKVLHPRQKPVEGSMLSASVPPPLPSEDQKEQHTVEVSV